MPLRFPVMVPHAQAAGTRQVTSPYNAEILGEIDVVDQQGIDIALRTAHTIFEQRNRWLPVTQRIEILYKTADRMQNACEDLALLAAREGGKPLKDSRVEVARAIDGVKNCIECLRNTPGREIPMNLNAASAQRLAFTTHEPIGTVVAVSAFNHPLNLIVHQVGPAIAAGCPVIVKPAGDTPLSCFNFIKILREAGLPDAYCQPLLTDTPETATALVSDARVSFLSFIGSAKVGWMLRSKLAPGARCALEHGGVAPVIVAADADLDDALPLIAKGGFYHAGQVCVSVQRVFAQRSIATELAQRLAEQANTMKIGDPANAATDIGPLIRPAEVERVHAWVQEAIAAGAQRLCGGKILPNNCYATTVLLNPPANCKVSQLEVFGPVICVYSYDQLDDAIQRANALPVAFQAAVFSRNLDTALYVYRHLSAATVMINDHTAFRVDWMPFAGLKESGYGTGGIPYTFRDMQIEKLMVMRSKAL